MDMIRSFKHAAIDFVSNELNWKKWGFMMYMVAFNGPSVSDIPLPDYTTFLLHITSQLDLLTYIPVLTLPKLFSHKI